MNLADFAYYWTRRVSANTRAGRILRAPLRLLPSQLVVPIVAGEARGMRWVVGSSHHGMWLGFYELEMQAAFKKHLQRAQTLYDIGSNVGFFTLLGSRLVGREGHVIAFEPVPQNIAALRRHIKLNRLENSVVVPMAVSNESGTRRMALDGTIDRTTAALFAHLSPEGAVEVQAIPLDEAVSTLHLPKPNLIKIDVEGAELSVLEGGRRTIAECRPTIFLSAHSDALRRACMAFLTSIGYRAFPLRTPRVVREDELIAVHEARHPGP